MRIALALVLFLAASSTRAQYVSPVPPPPPAGGPVWVPPYPGPAPDRFPSAGEFVLYSNWRLAQLSARERALTILGRTDTYRTRKVAALVVMGLGAAMFTGGFMYFFFTQGEDDLDPRDGKIAGAVMGLGVAVTLGGLVWRSVEKHNQPYHDEIRGLQREQAQWRKEQHRARREARLSLNGLQLKF